MILFLLWSNSSADPNLHPNNVLDRFDRLYAPLFAQKPPLKLLSYGNLHLVYYQLAVDGWLAPFYQEDELTSVLAINFPLNGHQVLQQRGISVQPTLALPQLARELQAKPENVLGEIAPPMLLFWNDKSTEQSYLLNDGLGHAQLFEYEHNGTIILSNRIFAFPTLNLPLQPVFAEWAVKCCRFFGWFPLNCTGFSQIKFAEPSTLYKWSVNGLVKQRLNVLEKWVQRENMPEADCLELARTSLIDYVKSTQSLFSHASGGLSGGYDSRAVFSTYRHLGLNLNAKVKGPANNYDVILAKQLAEIADFPLRFKQEVELPPESTDWLRHSICASLLWQAGNMVNHKLKTFLPQPTGISSGRVQVMGHAGAIGKPWFARKVKAENCEVGQYEEKITSWVLRKIPKTMLNQQKDNVKNLILDAYQQAETFGVSPEKKLTFFYLFERCRRCESGSQNTQTSLVLSPFLNANFIRAVFSYQGQGIKSHIFHRYIIETNTPDWASIPYEKEMKSVKQKQTNSLAPKTLATDWRQSDNIDYYNQRLYWQHIGRDLLEKSLTQGRYWREIYDPTMNLFNSVNFADELTMLYELEKLLN